MLVCARCGLVGRAFAGQPGYRTQYCPRCGGRARRATEAQRRAWEATRRELATAPEPPPWLARLLAAGRG